jgi:hypothetical protein
VTFVLAVATKLLPVVLVPLFWRRIRWMDAVAALALGLALYLPFADGVRLPLGAVPGVVASVRFNGPVFRTIRTIANPTVAAGCAVLVGVAVAFWARRRLKRSNPAAWAWPMAAALLCAPVIYPWYLLYFTPFLWSGATTPLVVWTITSLPVYLVWERALHGARWVVPWWIELAEFGLLVFAGIALWWLNRGAMNASSTDELD